MYMKSWLINDVINVLAVVGLFVGSNVILLASVIWLGYKLYKFAKEYDYWQSMVRKDTT